MNKIWLFSVSVCLVLALGSCKPKQSAYRAAYEKAKAKESTAPVVENNTYDTSSTVVSKANTAPISKPRMQSSAVVTRSERINVAKGEDTSRLKRYSVVIGSFRNKTNAYSLKERMINDGYNAVLGENEQGMLRVIVSSYADKMDAAASREAIKAKYDPNFQDAWLLEKQY